MERIREYFFNPLRIIYQLYVGRSIIRKKSIRDHAFKIAQKAGLEDQIVKTGSYWQNGTKRKQGVQIDLLIECADNITLICECKWSRKKTGIEAVKELRQKISLYPNKKNHTLLSALIAPAGVTQAVSDQKEVRIITLEDLYE